MDFLQSALDGSPDSADLVFLNPALDQELQKTLHKIAKQNHLGSPHIWLTSSGSTASSHREIKLIALSKKALNVSAEAVNEHLNCSKEDRWLNVLPIFHVGGLSIFYRAHLSASVAINLYHSEYKWNPEEFYLKLMTEKITLTSLVPTQVYDLVKRKYRAPTTLRAVVVGGAALAPELFWQAYLLGWPLKPSFGMTELCSQIATAPLNGLSDWPDQHNQKSDYSNLTLPSLQILKHIQVKVDDENFLYIKSPSLMSCFIQLTKNSYSVSPFAESTWFKTQDKVQVNGQNLEILGRADEVVKILGENVNLAFLKQKFATIFTKFNFTYDWALLTKEDPRLGKQLVLVLAQPDHSTNDTTAQILAEFNKQVLPFERVSQIKFIETIPRSALGKILYGNLEKSL